MGLGLRFECGLANLIIGSRFGFDQSHPMQRNGNLGPALGSVPTEAVKACNSKGFCRSQPKVSPGLVAKMVKLTLEGGGRQEDGEAVTDGGDEDGEAGSEVMEPFVVGFKRVFDAPFWYRDMQGAMWTYKKDTAQKFLGFIFSG